MDNFLGACPNQNYADAGQIFSSLFMVVAAATCNLTRQNLYPEDYGPKLLTEGKKFDFIVVGAGSAGATIAGRLSENPSYNVLLLEAGGDPPLFTTIPSLFKNFAKTKYDWEYYAEPSSTHSLDVRGGVAYLPRGKMLGGCSSINGMAYIRGNRKDYDSWEANGNTGWGYDNVLKYFKKTENLQIKALLENDKGKYHGTTGEIVINEYADILNMDYFIDAANELGYDFKEDINTENNLGYYKMPSNINNGVRSSPATAFLRKKKENLFIIKNALVSKVLINRIKNQATGVQFINSEGQIITVNTTREVIISAGAINSPQLLMLSGIGPAKHLQEMNIAVVADLPVGSNLQDHFVVTYVISLRNESSQPVDQDYTDIYYNYLIHRKGPLIGASGIIGFINTLNTNKNTSQANNSYPNVEIINIYFNKNNSALRRMFFMAGSYSEDFINDIEKANRESSIIMMFMILLNPKSSGEIKLRSSDPLVKPKIDLKYLDKKEDVDVMLQSTKYIQKFINTSIMKNLSAKLVRPTLKRCDGLTFTSDEYWVCYFRSTGQTGFHYAGSVKMGPIRDKASVVNSRLKVHGVKGLRVADASIMPNIVSANTNAAAIMIGEKAADMIMEEDSINN